MPRSWNPYKWDRVILKKKMERSSYPVVEYRLIPWEELSKANCWPLNTSDKILNVFVVRKYSRKNKVRYSKDLDNWKDKERPIHKQLQYNRLGMRSLKPKLVFVHCQWTGTAKFNRCLVNEDDTQSQLSQ